MRILHAEIAEAIASATHQTLEEFQSEHRGIPVGQDPAVQIVEVEYNSEEPDDNFIVQLADGRTFECIIGEVRPRP